MIRTARRAPLRTVALVVTASWLASGCGGESAPPDPAGGAGSGASPIRPARTLAIPGPATDTASQEQRPLDDAASAPEVGWDAPAGWTEVEPASSMRVAQYRVDGEGGAAECVVFYFGPNQGGGAMANAERWAGQFTQPDGSSSRERMKIVDIEGASVPVRLVEVTGTYDGGMTMTDQPATPSPGFMLLGGIVEGPDAPWFFKMTGPEAVVRAERERFVGVLRSFRVGQ